MDILTSRLSTKGQTTIPKPVRDRLRLSDGDSIAFEVREDEIVLRKLPRVDPEWDRAVETTLSEWNDTVDDDL